MKKMLFLVCFLAFLPCKAQKKYSFDYTLVFKKTYNEKSNDKFIFYSVNSKENNYSLFTHDKDSLHYTYHFVDNNGIAVLGEIDKVKFYKAETFVNSCKQTTPFFSLAKNKVKEYSYINLADTVINDTSYYHYVLKSTKKLGYIKRNNIKTAHFIVNKFSPSFKPFLFQSIMYEVWKTNKIIPNGFPKTIYFLNYDGTKDSQLDLVKALKIDKYLTIPEECDYTNKEIDLPFIYRQIQR
jgi:hypothetical protein